MREGKICGSLTIILMLITAYVSAQEVPWSYQKTSNKHFISFEVVKTFINGDPVERGDYIGVFYDSAGKLHCAGYMRWGYGDPLLVAYGQDGNQPGFEEGQSFHYRIWSADEGCVAPVNKVEYQPNKHFPDGGEFKIDGKSRVKTQSFFGHIISAYYFKSAYCQSEGETVPFVSAFEDAVYFYSESEELALDSMTGKINLSASEPGHYQIQLSSRFCLNPDTLSIEILPSPPLGLRDSIWLCPGDTATLAPANDYRNYYWSTNATSRKLKVSDAGTYTLQAMTENDCSLYDTVHVFEEGRPSLELPERAEGCGDSITISSEPSENLALRWSNGETGPQVTFRESGDHWVELETNAGCIAHDSIGVKLSPAMNIESRDIQVEHAACDARGMVKMGDNAIRGGTPPYQYRLYDVIDGNTIQTKAREITDVKPGQYELTVVDSMGCQQTMSANIRVTHQECDNPVIAPNRAQSNAYYFDKAGKINIYNRSGQLVKSMEGPAEWHGRDETGRQVPMGSYQVLINGQQKLQITVIR